jgi:tetratricopeptide (TPR) repeat protein
MTKRWRITAKPLNLTPNNPNGYFNRGLDFLALSQPDKAVADFTQVIVLSPDSWSAYLNRGLAYYDQGLYEKAVVDYNMTITFVPENPEVYRLRAEAYFYLKQYQDALVDWEKSESLGGTLTFSDKLYRGSAETELAKLPTPIPTFMAPLAIW